MQQQFNPPVLCLSCKRTHSQADRTSAVRLNGVAEHYVCPYCGSKRHEIITDAARPKSNVVQLRKL